MQILIKRAEAAIIRTNKADSEQGLLPGIKRTIT